MRVTSADMEAAFASGAILGLMIDVDDALKLKKELDEFINSSEKVLKGPTWNAVRRQMEGYLTLIDTRINNAKQLHAALDDANKTMRTWLSPDAEIDDSILPELIAEESSLRSQIASLEASKEKYNLSALISQLKYIQQRIAKIKELVPTDNNAYNYLSNTESVEEAYLLRVNSYTPLNVIPTTKV